MVSTVKMRFLDSLLLYQNCKLDEDICESIDDRPKIGIDYKHQIY